MQQTATHGFGHLGAELLQHLCVLPHDLRKHGTAQHSTRAEDKQVHTPAQSVSAPYELASMHPIGCFCLSNDIVPLRSPFTHSWFKCAYVCGAGRGGVSNTGLVAALSHRGPRLPYSVLLRAFPQLPSQALLCWSHSKAMNALLQLTQQAERQC